LGVERLRGLLQQHQHVAFDTSIFVYHLEANPKYVQLTDCIFSWLDSESAVGITSTITMMELLVKPYRESDQHKADTFYDLLSTYPNLHWISPDLAIADVAARIRAIHRLRTPDALLAATAVYANATAMLTNDPIFKRVPELHALVLDDYL
jgi:predicted nucleic acid-binding protein